MYNGDRVIYVKQGFFPVLPKYGQINGANCKIWHTNQEMFLYPVLKQMSTEQLIVQNVKHFRIGRDQLSSKVMMILRVTSIFVKKK